MPFYPTEAQYAWRALATHDTLVTHCAEAINMGYNRDVLCNSHSFDILHFGGVTLPTWTWIPKCLSSVITLPHILERTMSCHASLTTLSSNCCLHCEALGRQLRLGIGSQDLADMVVRLHEEGKLAVVTETVERPEPQIVCSLGLVSTNAHE